MRRWVRGPTSRKGAEGATTHPSVDGDGRDVGRGQRGGLGAQQDRHQRPDTLTGTNKGDDLLGEGGNDDLYGLGGTDNLLGGPDKDFVFSGKREHFLQSGGNKILQGGFGNDYVHGGLGSDYVAGQEGNDFLGDSIFRESSIDTLSGGDGNDVILVHNKPAAKKDRVLCGNGRDRVLADRADVIAPDCEKVLVVHGSLEDIERQEDIFYESIQRFFKGIHFPRL